MISRCRGCNRTSARSVCPKCWEHLEAEADALTAQYVRLRLRGIEQDTAERMIERRIWRFFKNGTYRPLARRATD